VIHCAPQWQNLLREDLEIVSDKRPMKASGIGVYPAGSDTGLDMAGSLPVWAQGAGSTIATSMELPNFRQKRLLFGRLDAPGSVQVYSAECHAGERLRVQMLAPVLRMERGIAPSFALIAQSLPYSADVHKLPFALPAGFSAVVAPAHAGSPQEMAPAMRDPLTQAYYYPGAVIDTRTLVGGRCYIVVWSPERQMGKFALLIGSQWHLDWLYWLQTPLYWWKIRSWFGLGHRPAYIALAALLATFFLTRIVGKRRKRNAAVRRTSQPGPIQNDPVGNDSFQNRS
jgi:hypothetical protein